MLQLDLSEFRRLVKSLDKWVKVCVLPTTPVVNMNHTSYKCMTKKWRASYEKNKYQALIKLILYKYHIVKIKTSTKTLCSNRATFLVDVYFKGKSDRDPLTKDLRKHINVDLILMGL